MNERFELGLSEIEIRKILLGYKIISYYFFILFVKNYGSILTLLHSDELMGTKLPCQYMEISKWSLYFVA